MPNADTLVSVHAYSGDLAQVQDNLPMYLHHGCPVVLLSPEDAPIQSLGNSGIVCLSGGLKGWAGPQTLERQIIQLRMLLRFPHKYFLLNDADSFCLSSEIPKYLYANPDLVWSNEAVDPNPAPSLLPKLCLQPPYFLSRSSIERLVAVGDRPSTSFFYPIPGPDGTMIPFKTTCIDHYMLQITYAAGLGHFQHHTGVSFETQSVAGLEGMAAQVRHFGKVLIHSVKTKPVLDRLLREHAEWRKQHG